MGHKLYTLKSFDTKAAMVQTLADKMAIHLDETIDAFGRASWAVSGGSTPVPLFNAIREKDIDWSKVTISLVDDRWVPESHDRSNAAMIKRELLQDKAAKADFLTLYRADQSPFDCADDVNESYQAAVPFSSVLLGMGPDGHTASLFPGARGLEEAFDLDSAPIVSPIEAIQSEVTGNETLRLTLSARAIQGCSHLRMMLVGKSKLEALEHYMNDESQPPAPIKRLLSLLDHPLTVYYADQ